MTPKTEKEYISIRSTLSHAFLQAMIAYVGGSYLRTDPPGDDMGIDAVGIFQGDWSDMLKSNHEITIHFQLKATSGNYTDASDYIGYSFDKEHYNKYQGNAQGANHHLILLMILPPEEEYETWLELSSEQLILKKCMYWVSLRGAPPLENAASITVKFPKKNLFSAQQLREVILKSYAEKKELKYGE